VRVQSWRFGQRSSCMQSVAPPITARMSLCPHRRRILTFVERYWATLMIPVRSLRIWRTPLPTQHQQLLAHLKRSHLLHRLCKGSTQRQQQSSQPRLPHLHLQRDLPLGSCAWVVSAVVGSTIKALSSGPDARRLTLPHTELGVSE